MPFTFPSSLLLVEGSAWTYMYSSKYKYPYHVPGLNPRPFPARHFDTVLVLIHCPFSIIVISSQIVVCLDASYTFTTTMRGNRLVGWDCGIQNSRSTIVHGMISPITSPHRKSRAKKILHHFNCCCSSFQLLAAVSHCLLCCVCS